MTDAAPKPQDVTRTLAGFVERRLRLELSTLDLAFLGMLRMRGNDAAIATFSEDQVFDAFEHVCHLVEPGAENVRARASHALRRLREQQLLLRVDGAGVVRAGEYALSRLGLGIIDFYLESQVLSRESLSPLTATLAATLSELVNKARQLTEDGATYQSISSWTSIHGTIDVTCRELLVAIEKRQLGLDHQQEAFQKEISTLLSADWFGSLEHCQSLLDTSAAALNELNEVLMRDTQQLHALLADLVQLLSEFSFLTRPADDHPVSRAASSDTSTDAAGDADAAGVARDPDPEPARSEQATEEVQERILADKCMRAAVSVAEQVDRIANWGAARQKAWSDYYDYVHRYLRDVVRLDPSRALAQRLRQQLAEHGTRPFALAIATDPGMRVLREPEALEPPPPVRRPRKPREKELEAESPQEDPLLALEHAVREVLNEGSRTLREITQQLTEHLDPEERFLTAGRIAEIFARLPQSHVARERPWVEATPDLRIEQRQTRPFPFKEST